MTVCETETKKAFYTDCNLMKVQRNKAFNKGSHCWLKVTNQRMDRSQRH